MTLRSISSVVGSSPRVRGKLESPWPWFHSLGLIPACAGKTAVNAGCGASHQAHPRVCGENRNRFERYPVVGGSSPRVRGKQLRNKVTQLIPRLIPACAGKTLRVVLARLKRRAHPRVCGENNA